MRNRLSKKTTRPEKRYKCSICNNDMIVGFTIWCHTNILKSCAFTNRAERMSVISSQRKYIVDRLLAIEQKEWKPNRARAKKTKKNKKKK